VDIADEAGADDPDARLVLHSVSSVCWAVGICSRTPVSLASRCVAAQAFVEPCVMSLLVRDRVDRRDCEMAMQSLNHTTPLRTPAACG
jgi:hypothetical protein